MRRKHPPTAGVSPLLVSLGMVGGVFVARWTLPTVLKGTGYVFHDLREKPHLIAWALLAGALWAVANSLSIFAVRDVGLAIAFRCPRFSRERDMCFTIFARNLISSLGLCWRARFGLWPIAYPFSRFAM